MEIIITEWALDSYLDLKGRSAFTEEQYKKTMRPDVLRLKNYPKDTKFSVQQFWSIAECPPGQKIQDGFKMKWDKMGNGRVEIRLPVGLLTHAFICEAYIKENPKYEQRRLARFRTHLQLIRKGVYTERGRLT
jgi:hypothetical protein